jgi:hypothetical protein
VLTGVSFGDSQLLIDGEPVVSERQNHIAHLTAGSTLADARNCLNALLTALEAHGLLAP